MILIIALVVVAFCLGILLQRLYPVGKILFDLGLRDLLPVPRNIPAQVAPLAAPEWDVPDTDRGNLELFILIGQSNMSGRGDLSGDDLPAPHPSIYMFNKDYRWYPAREPLGTMPNEVDWIAADGGTGAGPGLAFARELAARDPSIRIGLIQCARGSSSIADWQASTSQNTLYGACLRRVDAARRYGRVAGVLILQGEDDSMDPLLHQGRVLSASSWSSKFAALVQSLRSDLEVPTLPVVFAQIGRQTAATPEPNWEVVRQQQEQVRIEGVTMIRTDDLVLLPDAHFTTAGYVEIGRRFAAAYLELRGAR